MGQRQAKIAVYDARMMQIRREYGNLTGVPLKEMIKWKIFSISPALEHILIKITEIVGVKLYGIIENEGKQYE